MWLFFVFYEAIVARRIISDGSYILLIKEHCLRWTWFYLGMVQKNSAPEKIVYIWQIEANGIINSSAEKAWIYFVNDVFAAVTFVFA